MIERIRVVSAFASKAFYFGTHRFQNRTLVQSFALFVLILVLGVLMPCRPTFGKDAPLSKGGFLVFTNASEWQDTSDRLADAIVNQLKKRGVIVEWNRPAREQHTPEPPGIRPETATGPLKAAWDAYYELRFRKALEALKKEKQATSHVGPARDILSALIRFAQGQSKQARTILEQVSALHPRLTLPSDIYPPRFVRLFQQIQGVLEGPVGLPAPPPPNKQLRSIQLELIRHARKRDWSQVWALRIIPIGWNGRAELMRINTNQPNELTEAMAELEKGAKPSRAAHTLMQKIFPH